MIFANLSKVLIKIRISNKDNILKMASISYSYDGREWQSLVKKKLSNDYLRFTIVSYNVLSQNLLDDNYYLYGKSNQTCLSWDFRKWKLLQELQYYNADIYCLQEVQKEHYHDFFKQQLHKIGYDSVFKCRTGDKHDGCATFYNKKKFVCVTEKKISFKNINCSVLDRDNVAILLLLKPVSQTEERNLICVTNTHIIFNEKRGDIKLAQLMFLFASINQYCPKNVPLIMCGDFNMQPFSDLYNFIVRGQLVLSKCNIYAMSGQIKENSQYRQLENNFLGSKSGLTNDCKFFTHCSQQINEYNVENNQTKRKISQIFIDSKFDKDQQIMQKNLQGFKNTIQNPIELSSNDLDKCESSFKLNKECTNEAQLKKDIDSSKFVLFGIDKSSNKIQSNEKSQLGIESNKFKTIGSANYEEDFPCLSSSASQCKQRVNKAPIFKEERMEANKEFIRYEKSLTENDCIIISDTNRSNFNKNINKSINTVATSCFDNYLDNQSNLQVSKQEYSNDMSSSPDSLIITEQHGIVSHNFKLHSCYNHWKITRDNTEITTSHGRALCTVDYIFYSQNNIGSLQDDKDEKLTLTGRMNLFTMDHLMRYPTYLPDLEHGSDHYSLMSEFALKIE